MCRCWAGRLKEEPEDDSSQSYSNHNTDYDCQQASPVRAPRGEGYSHLPAASGVSGQSEVCVHVVRTEHEPVLPKTSQTLLLAVEREAGMSHAVVAFENDILFFRRIHSFVLVEFLVLWPAISEHLSFSRDRREQTENPN